MRIDILLPGFPLPDNGTRAAAGVTDHDEWAGAIDRIDLMHVMLGHPDLPLRVEIGSRLFDVEDFRFSPDDGVVLLLDPGAVQK